MEVTVAGAPLARDVVEAARVAPARYSVIARFSAR